MLFTRKVHESHNKRVTTCACSEKVHNSNYPYISKKTVGKGLKILSYRMCRFIKKRVACNNIIKQAYRGIFFCSVGMTE